MRKSEIARRVGCNPHNVSYVLAKYLGKASQDELRAFQENKADIVDSVAHRVLSSVTDKKIAKMSGQSAITAFAILTDKSQLLRGLATGINVSVLMDVVDAIRAKPTTINAIAINSVDHGDST